MTAGGNGRSDGPGDPAVTESRGRRAVRPGEIGDLDELVALRETRAWRGDTPAGAPGGFLLGCDDEQYREHLSHGRVLVSLDGAGGIDAFSVVLDDEAFRVSEPWARRQHADVPVELMARFEQARLGYFDQLVAHPGRAWAGTRVAFAHLGDTMRHHDAVLATTVVEPVINGAALPFLRAIGFEVIGYVSETYPRIGRLRSALYLLTRDAFEQRMARPDARRFGAWVGVVDGHAPTAGGLPREPRS